MLGFTPVQAYRVQYEWIEEVKASIYKGAPFIDFNIFVFLLA